MGRKAGHLALGIGKSSGATLTLIPEEWRGREIRLQEVVDILATAIVQRLAEGKNYGVALIAEGIMEYTSHEDLQTLDRVERDEHGHIRLAEINFADVIKRILAQRPQGDGNPDASLWTKNWVMSCAVLRPSRTTLITPAAWGRLPWISC